MRSRIYVFISDFDNLFNHIIQVGIVNYLILPTTTFFILDSFKIHKNKFKFFYEINNIIKY